MNDGIALNTSLSKYNEYNCLISNYFQEKINEKENLEEIISKIYPKFKTPIKYRTKFFTSKNNNKTIHSLKPQKYIINKSNDGDNSFYSTDNTKNVGNLINRKIYFKTPIKDRNKHYKKGFLNYTSSNIDHNLRINKKERNMYIIRKKQNINNNKIEAFNNNSILKNGFMKKYQYKKVIINYSNKRTTKKDNNNNLIRNKSYDNTTFKKKIKLIKKKRNYKANRQKTFDQENNNLSIQIIKKNDIWGKIDLLNYSNKKPLENNNQRNKNKYNSNIIDKIILIQNMWKEVNKKRIENFNRRFKKYKLTNKSKKPEIILNLFKTKRFLTKNGGENDIFIKKNKEKVLNQIKKRPCYYYFTKNNYMSKNKEITFLQRKIGDYLAKKYNIVKKKKIKDCYISKSKSTNINIKNNHKYEIKYNYRFTILPSNAKNKNIIKTSIYQEKREIPIEKCSHAKNTNFCYISKIKLKKNNILESPLIKENKKYKIKQIPKICVCNITKNYLLKKDMLKHPIIKEIEYISKIYRCKKEHLTKNIKNNSRNIINDQFKSYSTDEHTILKSKKSFKYTNIDEQYVINSNEKNIIIMQKGYINKLNEFILFLFQKISKNVNQFIFYIIKGGNGLKNGNNLFFYLLKRIINIYNNLLINKKNYSQYSDFIKIIERNLSNNINNLKKYNFINIIPKNNENDLINTQIFINEDNLINFLAFIIKIEHNGFLINNIKNIIIHLNKSVKLNFRNIFTIMRYADTLYEMIIQKKNILNKNNIKHNKIKTFYIKPKVISDIIYSSFTNNLLSFSINKNPNYHFKLLSFENIYLRNINFLFNKLIKNNKKTNNIFYSITKINKLKNNYQSSGEIDIFENLNQDYEKKEIINIIYDDYCYDKINKINIFGEEGEDTIKNEKIRHISKLSDQSETDEINEIDCYKEDIILNQMKQCFEEINE